MDERFEKFCEGITDPHARGQRRLAWDARGEADKALLENLVYLIGEAQKSVIHVSGPSHPLALEISEVLAPYVDNWSRIIESHVKSVEAERKGGDAK